MSKYELALEFKNTNTASVTFILEPWGNEYEVHPGSVIRVGFKSAKFVDLPILHEEGRIVVEGSEGVESTGIWMDGELVG
jgi:cytochrome c oxidase assembly protein Cox11